MKIFQYFSFFLLLTKILSQASNNNINTTIKIDNNTINPPKKEEEKPFNLTEALINFYHETFGNNAKDESNKDNSNNITKEEENKRRMQEAEEQKKLKEEIEKKAKLERIQMETAKKKEKLKQYQKDRDNFIKILSNNSFEESIQINLEKGERETLYLDLKSFTKIKFAIMVSDPDQEEKINLFFSGPNARGHKMVINQFYHKNYVFYEYETKRDGEYYIEITNKGTKDNEMYFLFGDNSYNTNKKKDVLDTQKIDKISMLLNIIDSNINQLRNKKKMEILKINTHNEKVDENNKYIIIYSIIEIFTMIIIFVSQSYYISSLVTKI